MHNDPNPNHSSVYFNKIILELRIFIDDFNLLLGKKMSQIKNKSFNYLWNKLVFTILNLLVQ